VAFGPSVNPKRTTVKVHPAAIQSLYVPGGQVYKFASRVQRDVRTQARRAAPKRSGALRRSIQSDRVGTNQYGCRFSVYSFALHAKFVEEGTAGNGAGWIYPEVRDGLRVHPAWGGYPISVQPRVHGQEAKPFMRRGLERGLAMNGLL
jgi:hypothetical protein